MGVLQSFAERKRKEPRLEDLSSFLKPERA